MTAHELLARWQARRDEWRRTGALVSGDVIAGDVIADLEALNASAADESLTLTEAARASGYSADHLRHLVASGQLRNAGRKHAPRVHRSQLPRKPSAVPTTYNVDADALSVVGRLAKRG